MSLLRRVWNSFFLRRLQDDIEQEVETHLALLEQDARAQGLAPAEARAQARKHFGSPAAHAERLQDVSSSILLNEIAQDTRYTLRQMRKHAGFTAVALLIVALGIGCATAIFSLADAVLFHSVPYPATSALVYLWTPNAQLAGPNIPEEIGPNDPDALAWKTQSHSFSSLAMLQQHAFNLARSSESPVRTEGAIVGDKFFETLGIQPEIGRAFNAADSDQGRRVAIISDRVWHRLFAARTDALGQTVLLDGNHYQVIGIMPKDFGYPFEGDVPYGAAHYGRTDIWIPLFLTAAARTNRSNPQSADAMIGRLRNGISVAQAQRELNLIEKRLDRLYPPEFRGYSVLVRSLRDTIVGPVQILLWILLGAVAILLLIACGNVSNLLLARAAARSQEIVIRASLGAARGRLMRQMLTEAVVLSLAGCLAGSFLSFALVLLLRRMNPGNIPHFDATALNAPVLLLAVAVAIVSGILSGLIPALLASRTNLNRELRKGGNKGSVQPSRLFGQSMIAVEVALSFALLIAAGLLIRSYQRLEAQNPGYLGSTLTMNLQLDHSYAKPEQRRNLFLRYLTTLRGIPGVLDAGAGSDIPLDNYESLSDVEIKGFGKPKDLIDARIVTPGYFAAFATPLLTGRAFTEHDMEPNRHVVIVNQAFVKAFLPRRDPFTAQIRSGSNLPRQPWAAIVGVVGNRKHSKLEEQSRPEYYQPYSPAYDTPDLHFAIRSPLPAARVAGLARSALRSLDPQLALDDVRTMNERMSEASARRRFKMILLSAFGLLAVLLALGGIYAVLSYAVRGRTKEMGLRMALGASRTAILTMVLKQGLGAVAAGLAAGMVLSLFLVRFIRSWLYGVPPDDPLTYALLTALVLIIAAAACLVPAANATRVDPATAIRNE